ncbi:NTP transferase domain-containing protein [Candidatus Chloroploca sp. Khr17]|uniref:nucleotidyltransferase family protein n=1 Tax=Candidatus Chloroploca sp. Khr17 TaxID=2496869 RepID=UPI00101C24EE|nr:nucleotidyltransferase family protein [Candidatus Chloroploca sp. Khr17]
MIYGVLLAAGQSRRMGAPKPLLIWRGQPLVRHVATVALASHLAGLTVVLGAEAMAVRQALGDLRSRVHVVECAAFATGQAASLTCGLASLPTEASAAVILLVDQPFITPGLINQLITTFAPHPEADAIVPRYQGQRGNPVLLAAALFPSVATLEGDTGARVLLRNPTTRVHWLDVADPAVCIDLDTPEGYQAFSEG